MPSLLVSDYTFWMTPEQKKEHTARERAVRKAREKFERSVRKAIEDAAPFLDDNGRTMLEVFQHELREAGALNPNPPSAFYKKAVIGRSLSKAVFERDGYRCVLCASHVDLTCDHIIAERDGGPTTIDNLQTMCRSCNCKKGRNSFSVLRKDAA